MGVLRLLELGGSLAVMTAVFSVVLVFLGRVPVGRGMARISALGVDVWLLFISGSGWGILRIYTLS